MEQQPTPAQVLENLARGALDARVRAFVAHEVAREYEEDLARGTHDRELAERGRDANAWRADRDRVVNYELLMRIGDLFGGDATRVVNRAALELARDDVRGMLPEARRTLVADRAARIPSEVEAEQAAHRAMASSIEELGDDERDPMLDGPAGPPSTGYSPSSV